MYLIADKDSLFWSQAATTIVNRDPNTSRRIGSAGAINIDKHRHFHHLANQLGGLPPLSPSTSIEAKNKVYDFHGFAHF